jgi:hypothetical protein
MIWGMFIIDAPLKGRFAPVLAPHLQEGKGDLNTFCDTSVHCNKREKCTAS